MKTILITATTAVTLLLGGSFWSQNLASSNPNIIATRGMHAHAQLAIYAKDQQIEIPKNLGVGPQFSGLRGYDPQMQMAAVHTHDDLPIIHLEFMSGSVYREDVTLGQLFKVWGKDIRSFGSNLRMSVNGIPNSEYENYVMQDGDKIVLTYE